MRNLENLTAHNLIIFRNERYLEMESINGRKGNFALGVCGNGDYAVKDNGEWLHFPEAEQAVEAYKKLIQKAESTQP